MAGAVAARTRQLRTRIRLARRAVGVTAAEAARAAGASPATFSRFKAGATIKALVGRCEERGEGIGSEALARLLGFDNAAALEANRGA